MLTKRFILQTLTLLAIFIACPSAWAATYYVSTTGNDSNPGTLTSPWKTVGKANSTLQSGDTVYIKGGIYTDQYVSPANSGTSAKPITYSNYNGEKVTIRDAGYGVNINGKSYINVNGIDFYNLDHFLYISNGSHNTISYCTFDKMRTYTWHGIRIYNNSQYNWLHHNTFSGWGYYTATDDKGALMDIGNESVSNDLSYYNLLEDNTLHSGGHHILGVYTRYTVIRNNYFHNGPWSAVNGVEYGDRNLIIQGYDAGNNLVEGNRIAFASKPVDDNGAVGMDLRSPNNIIRKNSFYNNKAAGIGCNIQPAYAANPPNNNLIYNNTFHHNGYDPNVYSGYRYGMYFADWGQGDPTGNIVKNNIFNDNENGAINYYGVSQSAQIVTNNWNESGNPLFVSPNATDPSSPEQVDFNLQNNSPAIDAGTWLTTVTGSGSGTSFQVQNAKYFMDGWGIIAGDLIQLEGQSSPVRVTKIDPNTNMITVNQSIEWIKGMGVSLAYQGLAPDLGAFENGTQQPTIGAPTGLKIISVN